MIGGLKVSMTIWVMCKGRACTADLSGVRLRMIGSGVDRVVDSDLWCSDEND